VARPVILRVESWNDYSPKACFTIPLIEYAWSRGCQVGRSRSTVQPIPTLSNFCIHVASSDFGGNLTDSIV